MNDYIFKATAINKDGASGKAYIKNGLVVALDHVTKKERVGTNPEELLALAWSTCLASTLKLVLKTNRLDNKFEVRVDVSLNLDKTLKKYFFKVSGLIEISDMSLEEMEKYITETDLRCPISQLISDKENVSLEATKF